MKQEKAQAGREKRRGGGKGRGDLKGLGVDSRWQEPEEQGLKVEGARGVRKGTKTKDVRAVRKREG